MNFAGKSGSTASGLFSASHTGAVELPDHGHAGAITVSDPYLLFSGDYKRSGPDLILSKDGREHVVENYFIGEKRAALAAPDGAQLSGEVVSALTGHVQVAQASGAVDAGKVIGHVTKLNGNATVIRNGVSIVLNMGDNVHKGDVVQSGSNSSLGITFIDGTVFGLGSNARMVLNEMIYDPNGSSNSSFLTLVQGTVTFVAGQTAKHGDMKVDTPVATMGIRGTACLIEMGFEVPLIDPTNPSIITRSIPVKFQVLQEADGTIGSYVLYAKTDLTYSNPVATINRVGEVTAFNANGQITNYQLTLIAPEVKALIDQTLKLYFPNYNPTPQIPGSTPANPLTPDTGNKQPINFQIDKPTTVPLDFIFSDPSHPGEQITKTLDVTITAHNTAPTITVNPVADKPNFLIKDQVVITDPDDPNANPNSPFNDVPHPYVVGSGKVVSATGPAYTPAALNLAALVNVDPATGAVSYNPESFAFLKAGDKVVVTIAFDANSGPDTLHQTLTLTIDGVNDAPVMDKATVAVSEGGTVILTAENIGVTDPDDASATFTVSNVAHGKFQTTTDGSVWVDATSFTTADLNAGHVRFVHDGGEAAPTFRIQADDGEPLNHLSATVAGAVQFTNVNDAPTVSSPVTGGGAEGSGLATVNLLNFASDADAGAVLHVKNLVWTDTGSGFPAGVTLSADGNSLLVDTNNHAYDHLAQGASFAAHFSYDVVDENGALVHQTATVTIGGTNDAPVILQTTSLVGIGYNALIHQNFAATMDPGSGAATTLNNFSFDSGFWVAYTLTATGDDLYALSSPGPAVNGSLYDFDATTGALKSVVAAGVQFEALRAESNGTLIGIGYNFSIGKNFIATIDPHSGAVTTLNNFKFDSGFWGPASLTASGNDLYALSAPMPGGHGSLYDFNATTGALKSAVSLSVEFHGLRAAPNGTLIGIGYDSSIGQNFIARVDPGTGSITKLNNFTFDSGAWNDSSFVVSSNDIYVLSAPGPAVNGSLYDFDATTGALKWVVPAGVEFQDLVGGGHGSGAVSAAGMEGSGSFNVNLLQNAFDVDDGAVLHIANLVRTDGGGMPAGFVLTPDGNSISVDTDSPAYNSLAQGQAFTAHFGYYVVDEHGASVHQTAAVTVAGTNDAPVFTTGPAITQLSVPANGVPFSHGETFAFGPAMSSDGRFVVFGASNQIPGQENHSRLGDVYLYDRLTGTYKWISDPVGLANSGITLHAGETYDGLAAISLDGQYVTFRGQYQLTQTVGQPLIQSETFLYNTSTGVTTLVPGLNGDEPSINANGSLIAATGQSLTAPSGNTFIYNDVLVTDRLGHVVTRISGDANASPVNTADISPDGRYVTFWSTAAQIEVKNVKPGGGPVDSLTFNVGATWPAGPSTPAGPVAQVYVFDRQTETINLVSVSPAGERGNGNSSVLTLQTSAGFIDIGDDWKSSFSGDGRFIIFQSNASNLVAGDNNGASDVFLYDLQTHQVQLVSSAAGGSSANGASYRPAISSDGHHIVFASEATNLLGAGTTPAGANGFQTYIRDFDPSTGLLSTGFTGFHNGDNQYGDSISRDGGIVAFGGAALAFNANQGQAELISVAAGTVKFTGGSISDYNPAADTLTVTVSVAHGKLSLVVSIAPGSGLTIVGGLNGSQGILKFTGSIDAINHALDSGVIYTPTAGGPDALAMTVTDGHGGTATHTMQFDSGAPQVTGVSMIGNTISFDHDQPQAQFVAQGQVKFFGDPVSDSTPGFNQNADTLTVTLTVGHGTLTPAGPGSGVTIVGGFDGHTGTLKFTGTIAAVNHALESGAVYAATSGGPDTLTVTVTDGHGGTATQSTQFNPQSPAIDGELTDGQYEIFVVDRAGGTAGLVIEDSSLTAPNPGTLLTKNAFGFTDPDLSDTHTATVIGSPVVDASHAPGFIVPAGGLGTFTPLAVTESAGSGQVPWTFTVDNALVQSLGKGQYITQTYAVQLDDHHGGHPVQNVTVTIAGINDAPLITHAALTIAQGHTVTLTTADLDFADPDNSVVTYTVSNLSHGHFEIGVGNAADVTTTFTSDDVVAGLVSFVDDGSSGTPTFSLTPNDGSTDGVTVAGLVTFSAANYTMTSSEGVIVNVTPEGATSGFVFPGAGNVTTPGIPEDRIAIGYDVGASHVVLDNAPLLGVHQMATISSETHSSGGTTFVSATLDAGHDVTLKQTLALGNDANFFTTTIDITNNGATDISNLRFLRNFDPDQDVQAHHDYTTFNDVVQKPDGAETFAIVSAVGVESHTTVAMVGLGGEWQGSVFGFTNTDPYAAGAFDTPVDPGGARADKSLSLTSSLGTLHAGDQVEVSYITTNNVATVGNNALFGTAGADTINGLGGDDLLIGLKGADTFAFNAAAGGSGHDTIADFTPGQDQISLDYHAFDAAAGPNDFANWLATHANASGSDVLIDLNVNGNSLGVDTILLKNVALASLQASDFHTL